MKLNYPYRFNLEGKLFHNSVENEIFSLWREKSTYATEYSEFLALKFFPNLQKTKSCFIFDFMYGMEPIELKIFGVNGTNFNRSKTKGVGRKVDKNEFENFSNNIIYLFMDITESPIVNFIFIKGRELIKMYPNGIIKLKDKDKVFKSGDNIEEIHFLQRPSGSKNEEYYTKIDIVKLCCNLINFNEYDWIVEPSAGNGAFSNYIRDSCLKPITAIDICPMSEYIQKKDYLEWKFDFLNEKKVLTIGNPPFGKQSSLAKKFIKRAILYSDTIAFILPKSFKKESMKNVFSSFVLIQEVDLPKNSFLIHGKIEYNVPCIFQIWKKSTQPNTKKIKILPKGYQFISKNKYVKGMNKCIYFHRAGSKAGTAFLEEEKIYTSTNKIKDGYYIINLENDTNKLIILDKLNDFKWKHNNTVGQKSISQQELIPVLNDILENIN